MTQEKKICFSICICQMTAILSGVSLLYLAVIVVIPSKTELAFNFHTTPIMCTTISAKDLAISKGKKPACTWTTCSEWCLSKDSSICMQIHVMVRNNGSRVNFRDCVDIDDNQCSALDVNLTRTYKCKQGECHSLQGLYECVKDVDNNCREIGAAFECNYRRKGTKPIECTDEKCSEPLDGVFTCKEGKCQQLVDIHKYWKDCERKCMRLEMKERNVVIFSTERLVATACRSMDSPSADNNTINEVSGLQEWKDKKSALFLFCTNIKIENGERAYDLITSDCFNATLSAADEFETLRSYMDLLSLYQVLSNRSEWVIDPESSLRIMNNTQLRINTGGCVNNLQKECKAFFVTHAHDGYDGMTQDRFPCYYTDNTADFVIGQYDPAMIELYLLLASILPACTFVVSCSCLFICSKVVGVDDEGHLRVTLLQGAATKEPVQFDELL